jgi:polyisoprenoid-binding protein YceI
MGVLSGLAVLLAPLALAAEPVTYEVRPVYANVSFTLTKWTVFKEEGLFRDFNGVIVYDPDDAGASQVVFTVQTASIDTKNETRDGVLRSDDFFDVARYPTMQFRSSRVVRQSEATLLVTGELTIRGIARQITVPVTILGSTTIPRVGRLVGFETTFTINRCDFGVLGQRWSGGSATLGDEVTIRLQAGGLKRE